MHFILHAPQIIWVILSGLGLILAALIHGKKSENKSGIVGIIVSLILSFLLYWWGGTFRVFELPQILLVAIGVVSLFSEISGAYKAYTIDFYRVLINDLAAFGLLYWAGFFGGK